MLLNRAFVRPRVAPTGMYSSYCSFCGTCPENMSLKRLEMRLSLNIDLTLEWLNTGMLKSKAPTSDETG
jgi:hypothetical protein